MRVLVTGSRDWTDIDVIQKVFNSIDAGHANITLVSGACPTGADSQAEEIARSLGWKVERYPADWEAHGKAAGPIRNEQMVNLGADLCVAFIKNNSRGASHTKRLAEDAGIKTEVVYE